MHCHNITNGEMTGFAFVVVHFILAMKVKAKYLGVLIICQLLNQISVTFNNHLEISSFVFFPGQMQDFAAFKKSFAICTFIRCLH